MPRFSTVQNSAKVKADETTGAAIVNAAKIYIADKNSTLDEAIAIKVATLSGAGLIDANPKSQQNNKAIEVTISGDSLTNLTFSISDGTWTKNDYK